MQREVDRAIHGRAEPVNHDLIQLAMQLLLTSSQLRAEARVSPMGKRESPEGSVSSHLVTYTSCFALDNRGGSRLRNSNSASSRRCEEGAGSEDAIHKNSTATAINAQLADTHGLKRSPKQGWELEARDTNRSARTSRTRRGSCKGLGMSAGTHPSLLRSISRGASTRR